jgi:hypothetical protein
VKIGVKECHYFTFENLLAKDNKRWASIDMEFNPDRYNPALKNYAYFPDTSPFFFTHLVCPTQFVKYKLY